MDLATKTPEQSLVPDREDSTDAQLGSVASPSLSQVLEAETKHINSMVDKYKCDIERYRLEQAKFYMRLIDRLAEDAPQQAGVPPDAISRQLHVNQVQAAMASDVQLVVQMKEDTQRTISDLKKRRAAYLATMEAHSDTAHRVLHSMRETATMEGLVRIRRLHVDMTCTRADIQSVVDEGVLLGHMLHTIQEAATRAKALHAQRRARVEDDSATESDEEEDEDDA
jgi:hypothetical protein